MDATQLREIQRPIKQRYRDEPDAAVITLRAEGHLSNSDVACSVETGRALVEAGLHPATGGDGSLACSGDMFESPAPDADIDELVATTERYCVVLQTLAAAPRLHVRHK